MSIQDDYSLKLVSCLDRVNTRVLKHDVCVISQESQGYKICINLHKFVRCLRTFVEEKPVAARTR